MVKYCKGETVLGKATKPMTIVREHWQLLLDLCHFSQDLNPLWDTKSLLISLRTLANPALLDLKNIQSQEEKFSFLTHYFFSDLNFQCLESASQDLSLHFLPEVLRRKSGPTPLLMLLFCTLLEESGISCQVTSCRRRYLLKVQLDGQLSIVDFAKKATPLSHHEIVDLINRGFDFSSGAMNSSCLVVEYLSEIKKQCRLQNRLQILSLVHSYLMKHQPFNLKHLSERALVAYETGNYRRAIEDIRSYFLYKQPEFTNTSLKKIYKLALKNQRNKSDDSNLSTGYQI